ncbi:hypothetical protein [Fusibacter sp. JL216-2]|uniref:hypothetical protein n=1 Tax=Fusibacter sp. JL216-2 TaxID=3071453 RepID=UPI003D35718A
MMKKRILIGTLAAVMALSTGSAFADTVSSASVNDENDRQVLKEKRQENRQEKRDDREEKMEDIIAQYYPEISDDWSNLRTDIDETRDAIRELVKPQEGQRPERPERPDFENMTDEEIEAYKEEMKEAFGERKPGERKPGQGPKDGGKPRGGFFGEEERPDFESMTEEEKEAWEAEREAEREEREAEREAFKTALEEEDTEAIKDHLNDMLEKMESHLENLEEKLETLESEAEATAAE